MTRERSDIRSKHRGLVSMKKLYAIETVQKSLILRGIDRTDCMINLAQWSHTWTSNNKFLLSFLLSENLPHCYPQKRSLANTFGVHLRSFSTN